MGGSSFSFLMWITVGSWRESLWGGGGLCFLLEPERDSERGILGAEFLRDFFFEDKRFFGLEVAGWEEGFSLRAEGLEGREFFKEPFVGICTEAEEDREAAMSAMV